MPTQSAPVSLSIEELLNRAHTGKLVTAKALKVSQDTAVFETLYGAKSIVPITNFYPNKTWVVGEQYTMLVVNDEPLELTVSGPEIVELLLEGIVPEIRDGRVRVVSVARQPGVRTKVGVVATKPDIDAVGACLGRGASRVKSMSKNLLGERIDIVAYHRQPAIYAMNALAVGAIRTELRDDNTLEVFVPQHKLLAALGGGNINAILAARLLGQKILIHGV